VAAEDPPHGEIAPPEGPVPLQGLEGVGGAGGVEATGPGFQGREKTAVEADEEDQHLAHAAIVPTRSCARP